MLIRAGVRALLACGLGCSLACAGLPPFGADLGKQSVGNQEERPEYAALASYFGYVAPGSAPDETRDGKKMYYLYMWIPAVAPEIGVRMLSPVKAYGVSPDPSRDFVDPAYAANATKGEFFDTWVRFERCIAAVNPEDIAKPCQQWVTFGENDDSSELPANPSGNKFNALLRVSTNTDDPLKALVRGMYRVAFTTYKAGDVEGTFIAQVGAPIELPGAVIARTPAELAKGVEKARRDTGAVSQR